MHRMIRYAIGTTAVFATLIMANCAPVRRYRTVDPTSIAGLSAQKGGVVFRINKTRDLPNLHGRADLLGREIDEGRVEAIYKGMAEKGTIDFEVRETTIKSHDNTFFRSFGIPPPKKELPEAKRMIRLKYREQPVLRTADVSVLLKEVSPDYIRYMVIPGDQYQPPQRWRVVEKDIPWADDRSKENQIRLIEKSGTLYLPAGLNGVITLEFLIDTGASEVNLPADVFLTLWRSGTITQSDFLPGGVYRLADGSLIPSQRFTIRKLTIGEKEFRNISASIGSIQSVPILGMNVLQLLGSYEIDHQRHVLMFR